jgi:hypothetical protein
MPEGRIRENPDLTQQRLGELGTASLRGNQIAEYRAGVSDVEHPATKLALNTLYDYIYQLRAALSLPSEEPSPIELTVPEANPFISPPPPPVEPEECVPPTITFSPSPTIMDFLFGGENAFAPGDGFLYTGNQIQGRIEIIDYLGLPTTTPDEIGQFDFAGGFLNMRVGVWGDTMYVTNGFKVEILDVTDRTNPILQAPLVTADESDYLLCFSQSLNPCICKPMMATVSPNQGILSLYSLDNPLVPTLLDTFVGGPGYFGISPGANASRRGVLFVASPGKLRAFNISNPTNISLFSEENVSYIIFRSFYQSWADGYIYLADNANDLLHIWNVKDPNNMFEDGAAVATSDEPATTSADGSFLYVTCSTRKLDIFDISTPTIPVLSTTIDLPTLSSYSYGLLTRDGAFAAHFPTAGLPGFAWLTIEYPKCCNCNPALSLPGTF